MKYLLPLLFAFAALGQEFTGRVVRTMDDLRSLRPLQSKPLVRVLGYYTPGDGGGGDYVLTNTVAGTNAYGGRVLAFGGASSWQLAEIEKINVRQFGASPTLANNEPFVEAAMAYANTLLIPTYVPAGRYTNTAPVDVPDNTVFIGDGETSTWVRNFVGGDRTATFRNVGIPVLASMSYPWAYTGTNITLARMSFAAAGPSATGKHLALGYANHVKLHDLTFYRSYGDWATALGACNLVAERIRVVENEELFEDGFHVIAGGNILATDLDINSGDDSIAISSELLDVPITNVVVANARVNSRKGNGIRIYRDAPSNNYPIDNVTFANISGIAGQLRNGAILLQGENVATTSGGLFGARNVTLSNIRIQQGNHGGSVSGFGQCALFHYIENLTLHNVALPRAIWDVYSITWCKNVVMSHCYAGAPDTVPYRSVYAADTDMLRVSGGWYSNPTQSYDTIRADRVGVVRVDSGATFFGMGTNCNAIRIRPGSGATNDLFVNGIQVVGATAGRAVFVDNNNIRTLSVINSYFDPNLAEAVTLSGVTASVYQRILNTGEAFQQSISPFTVEGTGSTTDLFTISRASVGSMAWRVAGATFQFVGYNGQLGLGNTFTDATQKFGRYGGVHYTTVEEPVGGMSISSGASTSIVRLGGGDANFNAATSIEGYAAANTTTTTGTKTFQFELPATARGTSLSILRSDNTFMKVASTNISGSDGVVRHFLYLE